MNDAEFWRLMDGSVTPKNDLAAQLVKLKEQLKRLTPDALVEFDRHLQHALLGAYSWDVWGAAYVTMGGCGDDMFEYFRAWLISRGEAAYRTVIANPDRLGPLVPDDPQDMSFEELIYVAWEPYEAATGTEIPPDSANAGRDGSPIPPKGEEWDFDDERECRRRLPALCARFL